MAQGSLSKELFQAAKKLMPGGVSSPVRAFNAVGGEPLFIEKGKGSRITDADGDTYIDYVMSWGPLIHGHAHPDILSKISKTLENGTSFGAPTGFEIELAKIIRDLMPSMDMIRFVNSGTEAAMSAIRLARAFTDRTKILKFDGCYHGHVDALLLNAGSGVTTQGLASSAGVPDATVGDTLVATYNDLSSVQALMEENAKDVAAILVEPVAGNMGVIPPKDGFLKGLRALADAHGALLIFDEVMTGFRVHRGSAQELYHVTPDLTLLGKIIGGGLPVGAYGGKAEIMEHVAPMGDVYQAGTLSGNPIAMVAGIKTLKLLQERDLYQNLEYRCAHLADEMQREADKADIPFTVQRVGSMLTPFFHQGPIDHHDQAKAADARRFARYHQAMLAEGVYLPASPFESWFVSTAHSVDDIETTIKAHTKVMGDL